MERLHGSPWPREVREKRGTQKRQKEEERKEVKITFVFIILENPETFFVEA